MRPIWSSTWRNEKMDRELPVHDPAPKGEGEGAYGLDEVTLLLSGRLIDELTDRASYATNLRDGGGAA